MSLRLNDPDALGVDFEQVIVSVILFTVLFTNHIIICSTSTALATLVLSCLLNPSALTVDFEQVIAPVICFLVICFKYHHYDDKSLSVRNVAILCGTNNLHLDAPEDIADGTIETGSTFKRF